MFLFLPLPLLLNAEWQLKRNIWEHKSPLKSRGSTNTTSLFSLLGQQRDCLTLKHPLTPTAMETEREKLFTKIQHFCKEIFFLRFHCHSGAAYLMPQGFMQTLFVGNLYSKNNINRKHLPREHNSPPPTESSWRFIRVTEPPEMLFLHHPSLLHTLPAWDTAVTLCMHSSAVHSPALGQTARASTRGSNTRMQRVMLSEPVKMGEELQNSAFPSCIAVGSLLAFPTFVGVRIEDPEPKSMFTWLLLCLGASSNFWFQGMNSVYIYWLHLYKCHVYIRDMEKVWKTIVICYRLYFWNISTDPLYSTGQVYR